METVHSKILDSLFIYTKMNGEIENINIELQRPCHYKLFIYRRLNRFELPTNNTMHVHYACTLCMYQSIYMGSFSV